MPNYVVSLAVLGNCLPMEQVQAIAAILRPWFDSCNEQGSVRRFTQVLIDVNATAANSTHSNLVIYFVNSSDESVIVTTPNFRGDPDGLGGLTLHPAHPTGEAPCEVYVSEHHGDLREMAITVFHEAMHNQLYLGNSLHTHGGAAGSPGTGPTRENFTEMHNSLLTRRRQWLGGWAAYERIRL